MSEATAPQETSFDISAASKLPLTIRFGTSTWTYPGWKGLIYHQNYKSEKEFKARSLGEYSECPLFRTVGIDSTFYAPPKLSTLQNYASLVPKEFRWVSKVWEHLTIPRYPAHPRYGKNAGLENSDFLNASVFIERVLPAYLDPAVRPHTGPFIFQFPAFSREFLKSGKFLERLHAFLSALPKDFHYGIEIRNKDLLMPDYFQLLNDTGATHCFNHWDSMPPLREQMIKAHDAGGLHSSFFVARILTPLGVSYERAVKMFAPYDKIKQPNPQMRKDVAALARRAIERGVTAFVIVNNRCEGNSPMTINAIIKMIVGE